MTNLLHRSMRLSEGEQSVLLAYIAMCVFGAGLSFTIVNQLGGQSTIIRALTPYDIWMIVAGLVGAGIGLRTASKWLGWPGLSGFGCAIVGIFVVSGVGAIAGGTLALPGYGTMFGPFALLLTFIQNPVLLGFWITTNLSAHFLFQIYRRERDTIFVIETDEGIPT